jgi:hypothetical protein
LDPASKFHSLPAALVDPPHLVEDPLHDVFDVGLGDVSRQIGHDEGTEGAIAVLERLGLPLVEASADLGESSLHNRHS